MPPRGLKRSRALWDMALSHPHDTRWHKCQALGRAIWYELQPLHDTSSMTVISWYQTKQWITRMWRFLKQVPWHCWQFLQLIGSFLCQRTLRQWSYVGATLVYAIVVYWVHSTLEAGPIILMMTALVAIFTVGLSDDESLRGGLSPYSVFNRGFERMLGTLDADALVAQHVGGGFGGLGGGMPVADDDHRRGRDPRPIRNRDDDNDVPAEAAHQPPQQQNNNNLNGPQAPARPSNKKLRGRRQRGRNTEQQTDVERDMELQREAARVMGFGNDNDDLDERAIQRLLQEE